MDKILTDFLSNRVLIAALLGWLIAQVLKTIIHGFVEHEWKLERMVGSGGMPSSHAATVCALTTSSILHFGVGSFEFVISLVLTAVVLHDARGVRLETGKQAKSIMAIMDILKKNGAKGLPEEELKELIGHTPFQVVMGSVLGIVIAILVG